MRVCSVQLPVSSIFLADVAAIVRALQTAPLRRRSEMHLSVSTAYPSFDSNIQILKTLKMKLNANKVAYHNLQQNITSLARCAHSVTKSHNSRRV